MSLTSQTQVPIASLPNRVSERAIVMGNAAVDITMSLDGFIAGPEDSLEHPLGIGGDRLHQWVYSQQSWRTIHGEEGGETGQESDLIQESFSASGAVIMGKRMFELGIESWGDEPPFHMPVFVLTHTAAEPIRKSGGTTFSFVTDGIGRALKRAQEAAGEKDVSIAGGADTVQQYIQAGLIDQMQIHIAPVLIGEGRRLFDHLGRDHRELIPDRVISTPNATHIRYRFAR